MREIKFRAKRIDMDRWIYGQYFITPLTDENSDTTPDKGWFFLTGEPRHCIVQNGVAFVIDLKTLGHFTGLKDKNDKEIYEGDLAKDDLGYGAVEYREKRAGFRLNYVDGLAKWFLDYTDDEIKTIEVIGDIYKISEVLKD